MKKILFLAMAALATASFLSYRYKSPEPALLTPECYISCYNADVRDQFRQEASTMAFANLHEKPVYFKLDGGAGKPVSFKAADGTTAMVMRSETLKKRINGFL